MSYDENRHNYGLAIQDVDGFTFSGANRKIANGLKILLGKYTISGWKCLVDETEKHNLQLNSTNTYSKHMPVQKHVGISPRTITVDCKIDAQSKGLDFAPTGFKRLDLAILQDLLFFNHRYYITDYFGSETDTETPIYQLMNDTSGLYYSMYTSQAVGFKGMPVLITDVSSIRVDPDDPGLVEFTLNFVEDSND